MKSKSSFKIPSIIIIGLILSFSADCKLPKREKTLELIGFVNTRTDIRPVISPDKKQTIFLLRSKDGYHKIDNQEPEKYPIEMGPVFGPLGMGIAYSIRIGNRRALVLDGKENKVYDFIEDDPVFSPDGSKLAYIARESGQRFVVINGEEGPKYNDVGTPIFSPDSRRIAYWAKKDKYFIVYDNKEGKPCHEIRSIVFSPDGNHIAYTVVMEGTDFVRGQAFVIADGKEGKKYDGIIDDSLRFSPDSQHLIYRSQIGTREYMVVDGKEYNVILFSRDCKRFAYSMDKADKEFFVVDLREQDLYSRVSDPVFSPDSKYFAYRAREGEGEFMVVNGKKGRQYDEVGRAYFSDDSQHLAYAARSGGKWFMVTDGKEGYGYNEVGLNITDVYMDKASIFEKNALRFSPDNKRSAYSAHDADNKEFMVVDGVESRRYDEVRLFTFSPDSRHYFFCGRIGAKWQAVVDGKKHKKYDSFFCEKNSVFSPYSNHVVYIGREGEKYFPVLDGEEGDKFEDVPGVVWIYFDSPESFTYLAIQGNSLLRIKEKIET